MAFKDILSRIGEKQRARKDLVHKAQEQLSIQKMLEEREKSANERELNRFQNEDRESQIKIALDEARNIRQRDIDFNHNPLDVQNITKEGDFQILKQKNIFAEKSDMFSNKGSILHSNSDLLKSGNVLHSGSNILHNNMRLLN